MMYERECLYDVRWQKMRIGLLGTWVSPEKCQFNIDFLKVYADEEDATDRSERYIRCNNYTNAILLGFGEKVEHMESAKVVRAAQGYFSPRATSGLRSNLIWDWSKVEADLKRTHAPFLKELCDNLRQRVRTSEKRTGGVQHRPELMRFVQLLSAEMRSRGIAVFFDKVQPNAFNRRA